MKYLLDTNVWVDYLNQRYPRLIERVLAANPDDLVLSAIVLAELRYGADKSQRQQRNHARIDVLVREVPILDFDEAAAATFGALRSRLELSGTPIGAYDMLIGAQALSRDFILVTDNERELRRIPELRVENWRLESGEKSR
ncbi:MAG TPA: type II toxin-antitoxin system VapC family toxin [Thermoanaerobaculia bacterium]|nr:type II toxin-antitoxin system VapC family toxin [Thermoanaerobaculia bacterium]